MDAFPAPGTLLTPGLAVASCVLLTASVALLVWRQSSVSEGLGLAGSRAPPLKRKLTEEPRLSVEQSNRPRVRMLYGTQTGTAERFSKALAAELRMKYGESMAVDVVDLENYKPDSQMAREKLVVLCLATYGDGEPTDNAADFLTWLVKEAEAVEAGDKPMPLQNVSYAVFGLGNKQYEHFNAIGKKVFKLLGELGATPLIRRGDGDDDASIDEDYDKWCAELQEALDTRSDLAGVKDQRGRTPTIVAPASYDVEQVAPGTAESLPFPSGGSGQDHHSLHWAPITDVRELHSSQSDRSCVHVEVDVSGIQGGYVSGDHVGVHACNASHVVEDLAGLLGLQLEDLVRLSLPAKKQTAGLSAPPIGVLSVRTLLSWHADLLASPHKESLMALAHHATDPVHAKRLSHLASAEGKQEYQDWIAKQHRSLLEVLREFPSARPPLGVLLAAVAPRLQPRLYSISSSGKLHPKSVHITCSVVRDTLPSGRVHEGVASTWLQRHLGTGKGAQVPVFLRHSNFKLPLDLSKPVVMVGPGTGLAPFRGFLQERSALRAAKVALGPAVLFFGCRSQATDYIYEQELAHHLEDGSLTTLHVAFSRDGASKDYVQHHMERQTAELWSLLQEQGGSLYVCGDAKHMAKDVHRTLVALVAAQKGCSGTQAEMWVKELQEAGRYQRDVW